MKNTTSSPVKATPTNIASNPDDVSTTSVSDADDVMMTRGNKFHVFQEGTNIWEEICQTMVNF